MKQKGLTLFGQIFLITWLVLCFLIIWAISNGPRYQPTIINVDNPFACEKLDGNFSKTNRFEVGQTIYICGYVRLHGSNLLKEVQIRIYEGERTVSEPEIFYDNVEISSGDQIIIVKSYLVAGNYEIQISDGRTILTSIQVEIIN